MVKPEILESIREMGDRSASAVMESLSEMLCMEVVMDVSSVNVESIEIIPSVIGLPDERIVGTHVNFSGRMSGSVLTILSIVGARKLADILLAGMDDEDPLEYLTEMQESAILEICNIMTSPFIDIIADAMSIELTQSPPSIVCESLYVLMNRSLDGYPSVAIAFRSALRVVEHNIDCNIMVLPNPDEIERLLNSL